MDNAQNIDQRRPLPAPRIVSETTGKWCDRDGELHDMSHTDLHGHGCSVGSCDRDAVWAVRTVFEAPRYIGPARVPGPRVAELRPVCNGEVCLHVANRKCAIADIDATMARIQELQETTMTTANLALISTTHLSRIVSAIQRGRISLPLHGDDVTAYVPLRRPFEHLADAIAEEINQLGAVAFAAYVAGKQDAKDDRERAYRRTCTA